ncbi:unnamed protein product [Lymnaea stagnalis]|uniref:C2H2-type domain-containing protein n=1 Tax=Lymnaea stagnalis TaxID=6523 RepID=A0AAV2HCE8_LYMST
MANLTSIKNLVLQSNIENLEPRAAGEDVRLTSSHHQSTEKKNCGAYIDDKLDSRSKGEVELNKSSLAKMVEGEQLSVESSPSQSTEKNVVGTSSVSAIAENTVGASQSQENSNELNEREVNADLSSCLMNSNSNRQEQNKPESSMSDVFEPDSKTRDKQPEKQPEERPVREMLVRRQRTESTETSSENKPVLETLTFSASKDDKSGNPEGSRGEGDMCICPCLLCDRSYPAFSKEDILAHLVLMHKFVIADVNYIANLPAYLKYWKKRFEENPITDFCSKIVTNTGVKDEAPKEEFFLLCDALPEDKDLREHLQRKKLEIILAQQQKEREETKFCRQCLFCKQTFCGNRAVLFDHLLRDHTFHMGQPDNLVFTDELFDLIQSKLDNQLCLFCEKSFKDKASLREHMRKKQHRKINPKNKEYDRFYIINYMEMGKNWESLQSEDNLFELRLFSKIMYENVFSEWAGWDEEAHSKVVCLFCDSSCAVQAELQNHMKDNHGFDLQEVNHKLQLNFYQKVKLINYIRRQIYHKTCYGCQESFSDKDALTSHMVNYSEHIKKVPDATVWDQPQYFFPTYEDDSLLCHLDDDDDGAAGDAQGVTVIAEDIPVPDTILKDQKLRRDLLKA